MTPEQQLRVISKAWGRNQKGYCFFPYIDREAQKKAGRRRAGYHEGDSFHWPSEREEILKHFEKHRDHDLYWCPSLFEYPMRREDVAMDEHALWADLDEVDPTQIEDNYQPTIAWETSPGRYQALWIFAKGDKQGASWPGNENQKLTYYLGADLGGWDTTQLLRVPGWRNHKYDDAPEGRLLWQNGRTYQGDDFDDLPDVHGSSIADISGALEKEIDAVDRLKVIGRVQLKLNHRARELLAAKASSGDRSENLWYLTRCLADVGCSVSEIVAVVRSSVWNKFADRGDEIKRLIIEATKAIDKRSTEVQEELEEEVERAPLIRMAAAFERVAPPEWLVEGTLTQGAVGFIAGQPKAYKSWAGLDLALSVATGSDFLNHFKVRNPGPVLYLQEEDPLITLKQRAMKIWAGKQVDRMRVTEDGIEWEPAARDLGVFDPDIALYVKQGVTISEEVWQIWLDERLSEGLEGKPYRLMVIDTLMRVAGNVDENRAVEMMTKIYRPLSTLAAKHGVAVQIVNHMRKSNKNDQGERGGQLMLGSQANHAWSEDSLYFHHDPKQHGIIIDFESKSAPGTRYQMGNVHNKVWEPTIAVIDAGNQDEPERIARVKATSSAVQQLTSTPRSVAVIAKAAGISYQSARQQLLRAESKGIASRGEDNLWSLT